MTDIIALLKRTSVSSVSDVLDQLGIESHCEAIKPVAPHFRIFGRAHTVRLVPQSDPPLPHNEYIDDLKAGEICVMEARGVCGAPVWGDLRALVAQQKGVAGTIIDGVTRDVAALTEMDYPVFSRGVVMRMGKGRIRIEEKQVPVAIDGILISPGDLVFGDADGVVSIPQAREAEVLSALEQMEDAEDNIKQAIRNGAPLVEARRTYGFRKTDKAK